MTPRPERPSKPSQPFGRTTNYRGIIMRSRLEADYARILDLSDTAWKYEPECFADVTGQYLPDFWIEHGAAGGRPLYVEVKPLSFSIDEGLKLRRRMEIIWGVHPDAALQIAWRKYGTDSHIASLYTPGAGYQWDYWTRETGIKAVS